MPTKKRTWILLLSMTSMGCFTTPSADAFQQGYTNEAAFIADIEALGYCWTHESFEEANPWGSVRSTIVSGNYSRVALTNWSIVWTSNNGDSKVTTSQGAAHTGSWGFYTLPHGSYLTGTNCNVPGNCTDGFVGTCERTLVAVGGWLRGFYGSKIDLYLDEDTLNPVDFPRTCDDMGENCDTPELLTSASKFFGVIDTDGFTRFRFHELEGKQEDAKYIWADDFTFGFPQPPPADLSSIAFSGEEIQIEYNHVARQGQFSIECSTNIMSTNWLSITNFVAAEAHTGTVHSTPTGGDAFYRIVAE